MNFETVYLDETDSTNRWLREHGGAGDMVVWTGYQTAGRGCGSNTWESERGKNLLFSVLVHPADIPATRQFLLTEAMALAVHDSVGQMVEGEALTIKWPNDIYWRDRKLAGTLSECALSGQRIRSCIIGTGLNLNQTVFRSDAPNPVSLAQITGREQQAAFVLRDVVERFSHCLQAIGQGRWAEVHAAFCSSLYRRDGVFAYRDANGLFRADIEGVEPDGHLLLRDADGLVRRYGFKEVTFVI